MTHLWLRTHNHWLSSTEQLESLRYPLPIAHALIFQFNRREAGKGKARTHQEQQLFEVCLVPVNSLNHLVQVVVAQQHGDCMFCLSDWANSKAHFDDWTFWDLPIFLGKHAEPWIWACLVLGSIWWVRTRWTFLCLAFYFEWGQRIATVYSFTVVLLVSSFRIVLTCQND